MPKKRSPTYLRNHQFLEHLLVSEKRGIELSEKEIFRLLPKMLSMRISKSARNLLEMARYCKFEGSFEERIVGLRKIYKSKDSVATSPVPLKGIKLSKYKELGSWKEIVANDERARFVAEKFYEKVKTEGLGEKLRTAIGKILKDFALDRVWGPEIFLMVASNYYKVPEFNLWVVVDPLKQKASIEVYPTTTVEDIRELFQSEYYKELTSPVFKKASQRKYYSKKRKNNLEVFTKYKNLKDSGELSDIDVIVKIFESDLDISKEADLKRVARIRTIKSRLKKSRLD